jgi:tRNA modification GTPase
MDPIIAPVSALVSQPVGILRISGDDLWPGLRTLFPGLPEVLEHRRIYYGSPVFDDLSLDECLLLYFKSPHSFTGEDVLEIQAHGNPHNIRALLDLFIRHGIRMAKPGEFSLRAYHNKKMSLLKAESLHRMIQAPSYDQFRSSHQQFSDEHSHPLFRFQEQYLDLIARFFAILDYPESEEEALHSFSRDSLVFLAESLINQGLRLISDYRKNRRLYNGFTVLIAGHPNSGKSSLFNRLLKENRAIISPLPGTTRDLVEGRITFNSGDVIFLDSAGLRPTQETVEQEGILKARKMLKIADCILWIDSPEHPDLGESSRLVNPHARILHLWNKCDISLPDRSVKTYDHVVSARTRKGLPSLVRHIESLSDDFYRSSPSIKTGSLESERQREVLSRLLRLVAPVPSFLTSNQYDLALALLEEGRRVLDDGIGMSPSSDIYDRVFRLFCLGK